MLIDIYYDKTSLQGRKRDMGTLRLPILLWWVVTLVLIAGLEQITHNTCISLYAGMNKCHDEQHSRISSFHSSTSHCMYCQNQLFLILSYGQCSGLKYRFHRNNLYILFYFLLSNENSQWENVNLNTASPISNEIWRSTVLLLSLQLLMTTTVQQKTLLNNEN